ncbi:MAG: aminotransferase class I/II-fold pyridoxal phosphate-dependent enzyme [Clostridia bacterium]|nr:aminotransferase class I/II-fold pyridoxal phosphate-dependent enzyme [Clostridia bacterium]
MFVFYQIIDKETLLEVLFGFYPKGSRKIRFGIGQLDFNTSINVKDAGKKAIDENKTRYTASTGIKELKNVIVNKFKRDNKLDYEVENILVENGAKHLK